MAKFKALKKFFDKVNDKSVKEGEIIDITIKEVKKLRKMPFSKNLKDHF